jgi:hypothetical protein
MTCTLVGDEVGVYRLLLAGADRQLKNAKGMTAAEINSRACEKGCSVHHLFDCSHAMIRALLAMRTSADVFRDTYELGLAPVDEDFQQFLHVL